MFQKKLYSKILFVLMTSAVILGLVAMVSQLLAYFNSGADRREALHLATSVKEVHSPRLEWLPDDPETGREMEKATRHEITEAYIRAWYQWQLSHFAGEPVGMKEYFTPEALGRATAGIAHLTSQNLELHQTDLEHHLQLHFYAADGQLVSFTDRQVRIWQRMYQAETDEKLFSEQSTVDYQVVMVFMDGYWRIRHLVRQPSGGPSLSRQTVRTANSFVTVINNQIMAGGKPFTPAGINYYPQKSPWTLFWKSYRPEVVAADFSKIRGLGLNTIRVFVNFQDFGKGNVPTDRLNQLENMVWLAQQNNLKVVVTLFDFVGDYRLLNVTATDRQLEAILSRLKNSPAIMAWDLKNEPDLDFKHHARSDVLEWLSYMAQQARRYDPNHLITIGWAYPENAHLLAGQVDVVSFHSYKALDVLSEGIDLLKKRTPGKPLLLEEFGLSTYRGVWSPLGASEEEQVQYVRSVRDLLRRKGNIPYIFWTLYDFETIPPNVFGAWPWNNMPQLAFGIFRTDGRPKPAAIELNPSVHE